jgi:hypothetical protein
MIGGDGPMRSTGDVDAFFGGDGMNRFYAVRRGGHVLLLCGLIVGLLGARPAAASSIPLACDQWINTASQNGQYYALTDVEANYYGTIITPGAQPVAGSRIRIDAQFPAARNFSITAYKGSGSVMDSITDYQVQPNAGSQSAYLDEVHLDSTVHSGGSYTVYIEFTPRPSNPAPNTLYEDPAVLQNDNSMIVYRVYLPSGNAYGGVGLPRLTVQTPNGNYPAKNYQACQTWAFAEGLGALGFTINLTKSGIFDFVPASNPKFRMYNSIKGNPLEAVNVDNKYLYAVIKSSEADMALIRGRAPYYTTQSGVEPQVRHWSMCENSLEFMTYGCIEDHGAAIDSGGYYNIVISPPNHKPANATHSYGFDWLTYGTNPTPGEGNIIYRQMLAAPSFTQAISNVARWHSPVNVMGDYYPQITYCSASVFSAHTAAHESPASVFAACQAGQ